MGKSLLVVGFNSRPIAKSLYRCGFVPYAIDFFGDLDLSLVTAEYAAVAPVLEQTPQKSFQEIMLDLAFDMVKRHPRIEGCFLGSGFDDQPELVGDLCAKIPIIGNDAKGIRMCRDFEGVRRIAKEAGFRIPKTIGITDSTAMDMLTPPYVLTPKHSSGGLSKRLIQSQRDFKTQVETLTEAKENLIAEEFIGGYPMSCTFIKTGEVVKILAINDQVIGEPLCNPPGSFYYCGNVTPSQAPAEITTQATDSCQKLAELLPVQGMNGIDFVGTSDGIYFMEVNPRIPGSLAPIEVSLDRPLLEAVFLPTSNLARIKRLPKYIGVKYILYAPCAIPTDMQMSLRNEMGICDIPTGEQIIEKGDPICTVLTRGTSAIETLGRTRQITREIYRKVLGKHG